jgi:hypothetical protein
MGLGCSEKERALASTVRAEVPARLMLIPLQVLQDQLPNLLVLRRHGLVEHREHLLLLLCQGVRTAQ